MARPPHGGRSDAEKLEMLFRHYRKQLDTLKGDPVQTEKSGTQIALLETVVRDLARCRPEQASISRL